MNEAPILVAGASGQLGRRVALGLLERGHRVRVLAREPARLGTLVDRVEVVRGDALAPDTLEPALRGAAAVFSAVGARMQSAFSAGRAGYLRVDTPANLNLIAAAERAEVSRFVYTSLHQSPMAARTAYARAHELVVDGLRASPLDWCALRPTGFHSAFLEMLMLAKKGSVPLFGDGTARTNPIADADLASAAVDRLLAPAIGDREPALGGPEILSRRQIAELACRHAGRGIIRTLPPWLGRVMAACMRPLSPRMSDLVRFVVAVSSEDAIAPAVGTTPLTDTYAAAG
jgi:uncharacterized protein YbjT (DUF2867 family)